MSRTVLYSTVITAVVLAAGGVVGLVLGLRSVDGSSAGARSAMDHVKLHGRWTIEIRSADGRRLLTRHFENALQPTGRDVLAKLLARQGSVGFWLVELSDPTTASRPCASGTAGVPCFLVEPNDWLPPGPSQPKTLAVSYDSNIPATVLSGSVNAGRNGQISTVTTYVYVCDPSVPPSTACYTQQPPQGTPRPTFTTRTLSPPVPVQTGQQIAVTIQFTFS
jgi:hypothetical protein